MVTHYYNSVFREVQTLTVDVPKENYFTATFHMGVFGWCLDVLDVTFYSAMGTIE